MKSSHIYWLLVFSVLISNFALGGYIPEQVCSKEDLFQKQGVVERTTLFKKAILLIKIKSTKTAGKIKSKFREMDELAELFCTLSIDTTLSTLDNIGHLAASLCCLSVNRTESNYPENPAEDLAPQASNPPTYSEVIAWHEKPEIIIQQLIKNCYERYLSLDHAACYSLIQTDLQRALDQIPDYQGSEMWHSALLYQLLRKVHIKQGLYRNALPYLQQEFLALSTDFIEKHDPSAIFEYALVLQHTEGVERAFDIIKQYVSADSRPYIRRHAILWRARYFEDAGQLEKAETAYLDLLACSGHDSQAFLALINFLKDKKGDLETAKELAGIINLIMKNEDLWWHSQALDKHITEALPEDLRHYTGSPNDIRNLLIYFTDKKQYQDIPGLAGLLKLFISQNTWTVELKGYSTRLIRLLTHDIPLKLARDADSYSPPSVLEYFKVLYSEYETWIPMPSRMTEYESYALALTHQNLFTKAIAALGPSMVIALPLDEHEECMNNIGIFSEFVVNHHRQIRPCEPHLIYHVEVAEAPNLPISPNDASPRGSLGECDGKFCPVPPLALDKHINHQIKNGNFAEAASSWIELTLQRPLDPFDKGILLCHHSEKIIPYLTREQVEQVFTHTLTNLSTIHYEFLEIIAQLIKQFGANEVAIRLEKAVTRTDIKISSHNINAYLLPWIKENMLDKKITTALLKNQKIRNARDEDLRLRGKYWRS